MSGLRLCHHHRGARLSMVHVFDYGVAEEVQQGQKVINEMIMCSIDLISMKNIFFVMIMAVLL